MNKWKLKLFSLISMVMLGTPNIWASSSTDCVKMYDEQSYKEALIQCEQGANQGDAKSQFYLGLMYNNGEGVNKDYVEAVKWYSKAVNQGNVFAHFHLGLIYVYGATDIERDYAKAIEWLRKGSQLANPETISLYREAVFLLGVLLAKKGSKYSGETSKWLSVAAQAGHEKANDVLFKLAMHGNPFTSDWNEIHPEKYILDSVKNSDEFMFFNSSNIKKTSKGIAAFLVIQSKLDSAEKTVMTTIINCTDFSYYVQKIDEYKSGENNSVRNDKISYDIANPQSPIGRAIDKVCKESTGVNNGKINKVFGTAWPVSGSYVVTNNHVVAGRTKFTLLKTNGDHILATIVMQDEVNDLALMKVSDPSKMPPILTVSKSFARIGDKVFTIGYPHPSTMGTQPKMTDGTVSAVTGLKDDPRTYQISVPLQAGNSGGPLLNMHGEVIGIVTAKLRAVKMFKWTGDLPQNVNYAVKSAYLSILLSTAASGDKGHTISIKDHSSLADLAASIKDSVMIVVAE